MGTARSMDRRSFLKGATVAGAAAAAAGTLGLAGCAPQDKETVAAASGDLVLDAEKFTNAKWNFEIPPEPVDESKIGNTVECEILVIGAGVSGLVTATSAVEEGADVVVIASSDGPVSRGGSNAAFNTRLTHELGLDFTREEIDAMYDDIVEFAELEDFMDQKLKNYSSGMQVRLAFSVAIKAQGDILVLDEVLAVGDEAFQRKCDNFFAQMKKDPTKTIILVTHSMDAVKRYCDKAILIKDGEIVVSGNKDDVADQYTLENLKVQEAEQKAHAAAVNAGTEYPAGLSERVPVLNVRAEDSQLVKTADPFRFLVDYEFNEDVEFYLTLTLLDMKRGGIIYDTSADLHQTKRGRQTVNGDYRLTAQLRSLPDPSNIKSNQQLAYTDESRSCDFAVRIPGNEGYGLLNKSSMQVKQLD